MRLKLTLLLCLITLAVNAAYCETYNEFVEKAKARYSAFQSQVSDVTMVQESKMMTANGDIPVETKIFIKDKKFRAESNMNMGQNVPGMPAMTTTIISDGKEAWMYSPVIGKKQLSLSDQSQYQDKSSWWSLMSDKAQITGEENVGGRSCHVIEAKPNKQNMFKKIWIDKNLFTLVKADAQTENNDTITMVFSDFKSTSGDWEMPYKTDMYINGQQISVTFVKSIELNKGVSDDLFDVNQLKSKESGNINDLLAGAGMN